MDSVLSNFGIFGKTKQNRCSSENMNWQVHELQVRVELYSYSNLRMQNLKKWCRLWCYDIYEKPGPKCHNTVDELWLASFLSSASSLSRLLECVSFMMQTCLLEIVFECRQCLASADGFLKPLLKKMQMLDIYMRHMVDGEKVGRCLETCESWCLIFLWLGLFQRQVAHFNPDADKVFVVPSIFNWLHMQNRGI